MKRLNFCRTNFRLGFVLAIAYGVIMMGMAAWGWTGLSGLTIIIWGGSQIILGTGVICLYKHQRISKWGAVGAILILSGVLTLLPPGMFLTHAVQAIALTGFSLVLYDLEKINGIPLMLPGGLIFLSVIGSILVTPLMAFSGLVLLTLGSAIALKRI